MLLRSVKVYYASDQFVPHGHQMSGQVDWYWADDPVNKGTKIHQSTNPQGSDYVLLPKYTKGRYLILENPTGFLALNEIEIEFSEAHAAPPLKDCSEVYRAGVTAPDWYQLDTTGQNKTTDELEVYCEDGWTYILMRNTATNHNREVRKA